MQAAGTALDDAACTDICGSEGELAEEKAGANEDDENRCNWIGRRAIEFMMANLMLCCLLN